MNSLYKCQVESFDPFQIDKQFKKQGYENKLTIDMNDKWRFHRMGIVGEYNKSESKNKNQIGWMATLEEILVYVNLNEKVIDVVKIDTEGSEFGVLESLNIEYACKYFKQFCLETHPFYNPYHMLELLRKLDKCFLLFRRETRFLKGSGLNFSNQETEFQSKKFRIDLFEYKNEIELINNMIVLGELHFLNRNFLV